jgi:hypothetical protein
MMQEQRTQEPERATPVKKGLRESFSWWWVVVGVNRYH